MALPPLPGLRYETSRVAFLRIAHAGIPLGDIQLEVYSGITPKTADNFMRFCNGDVKDERGRVQGYKGSRILRAQNGLIEAGDFVNGDGTGSTTVTGARYFPDENFDLKHTEPGSLSMVNSGPNTNGCRFLISTRTAPELDNRNVVFGRVLKGMDVVKMIEEHYRQRPGGGGGGFGAGKGMVIMECGEM